MSMARKYSPYGKCDKCGGSLPTNMQRGTCETCQRKDRDIVKKSKTNKILEHPDLRALDQDLNQYEQAIRRAYD